MKTFKLTLEVTYEEGIKILNLLNTSPRIASESAGIPTVPLGNAEVANAAPKVTPIPKRKVTMPAFSRTQEQIDTFSKKEAERITKEKEKKTHKQTKKIAQEKEQKELQEEMKSPETKDNSLLKPIWLM